MPARSAIDAEAQIRAWIDAVVVDLNICPFAKRELDAGRVRICSAPSIGTEQALAFFADQAISLINGDVSATTLVVFGTGFDDFDDYLDLLELCEALLEDCHWSEALQLASFHPDYCFEGAEPEDAANFTNRSPLPVIHLLRQDDVAKAIANYPAVDDIPERNQALAREQGSAYFLAILERCRSQMLQ